MEQQPKANTEKEDLSCASKQRERPSSLLHQFQPWPHCFIILKRLSISTQFTGYLAQWSTLVLEGPL